MDRNSRLIMLIIVIVLVLYRLVRYFRAATDPRPSPAIPPSGGIGAALGPGEPAAVTAAPRTTPGLLGRLTTVLVWVASNLVLWLTLFAWPALANLPVIWRLLAGVFANFYLIGVARAAGARVSRGALAGTASGAP